MPKKITNPIREGLPSKIYSVAYGEPISGYKIAKIVYGIEEPEEPSKRKQIPPTDKIYKWLNKLEGKYFTKKEEGYLSDAKPLLEEIKKILGDLSEDEERILYYLLDSKEFRSFVKSNIGEKLEGDIDSTNNIMVMLMLISSMALPIRKSLGENKFPDPRNYEEYLKFCEFKKEKNTVQIIEDIPKISEDKLKMEPPKTLYDLNIIFLFIFLPESLMKKLSKIHWIGDYFEIYLKAILGIEKLKREYKEKVG